MGIEKKPDKANTINNEFLISISQEIITSLNGIVGAINLIKNHEHSSAIKDLVETLDISISRLDKFAYKILLSSQLSSNQYSPLITDFSLKDLIQYSIMDLNELIQQNDINVITKSVPAGILLRADRDLVFRAIGYILNNSIKYSPKNSNIEIEVSTMDNKIICSFLDYGEGFSQQALSNAFLPLHNTDADPNQKGGLSLYLVKQIMNLHNGEIKIYNKEGAGACVELVFNSTLKD